MGKPCRYLTLNISSSFFSLQPLLPPALSLRQLLLPGSPLHAPVVPSASTSPQLSSYLLPEDCWCPPSTSYDLVLLPPTTTTQLLCLCFACSPLLLFHLGAQSRSPCEELSQTPQELQACLEGERLSTSKCFCLVPDTSLTGGCLLINSQLP